MVSRNLLAEHFAIDSNQRLVKVALAVEEEHAEILTTLLENLRNRNGALAG